MAQVFEADGTAAKDYVFERKCLDGKVLNVHIMLPSERTGQRCAFVQYEMHACALSALELSNQYRMTPSGAPIVVRFADTQGAAKRQRAW